MTHYRQMLIEQGLLNPNPVPPPDHRPTLPQDDWGLHEAARAIAQEGKPHVLRQLRGPIKRLVDGYLLIDAAERFITKNVAFFRELAKH